MAVCESVERCVRLDGPWDGWFPVVRDSLSASGFREVAADAAQRRLTARYGDSRIGGWVTVTLGPSGPSGGTNVAVAVSASLRDVTASGGVCT